MNTEQQSKDPCFASPGATEGITASFHSAGDHSDALADEEGGMHRRLRGPSKPPLY